MIKKDKARSGFTTASTAEDTKESVDYVNPVAHYLYVKELEEKLNKILEQELKGEFKVANYENGKLVVFCKNAAVASAFRYKVVDYVDQLKKEPKFYDISTIRVRVANPAQS